MTFEVPFSEFVSNPQLRIDVIKMDCEGSELDILQYGTEWGRARLVLAEYSTQRCRKMGVGKSRFVAALENMQACGFTHAYFSEEMCRDEHWTMAPRRRHGLDDNIWLYRESMDRQPSPSTREWECRISNRLDALKCSAV